VAGLAGQPPPPAAAEAQQAACYSVESGGTLIRLWLPDEQLGPEQLFFFLLLSKQEAVIAACVALSLAAALACASACAHLVLASCRPAREPSALCCDKASIVPSVMCWDVVSCRGHSSGAMQCLCVVVSSNIARLHRPDDLGHAALDIDDACLQPLCIASAAAWSRSQGLTQPYASAENLTCVLTYTGKVGCQPVWLLGQLADMAKHCWRLICCPIADVFHGQITLQ
jgi:hypothetical protein